MKQPELKTDPAGWLGHQLTEPQNPMPATIGEAMDMIRAKVKIAIESATVKLRAENEKLQDRLRDALDKHRWIPVEERLPGKDETVELLKHGGWVDCGVRDAYGNGFCIGIGKLYIPEKYYTHWRSIDLPEQALKEDKS